MTVEDGPSTSTSGSTTPLLADQDDGEAGTLLKSERPTPLPKFQLFVLCVIMLAEPASYTQIFPYINGEHTSSDMCMQLGYAKTEKEVGFISGLIDSLFAIVQVLTVMHWGRLSDRIGRRPVLIMGLLGMTTATILFGLSQQLWLTILARVLAGALCGNGVVSQSIVSELTDETNEAQAFAFISLMWAIGVIVGTSMGGTLSRPVEQLPWLFGHSAFWARNPYLLPCLVAAGINGVCFLFAILLLKETLPSKVKASRDVNGTASSYGTISETSPAEAGPPLQFGYKDILRGPAMIKALMCTFLMMFTNQAWDVVFILYAYTSLKLGGLSMSNIEIGYCLAFAGCIGAIIQTFIFPRIQRRVGMTMYPHLLAILLLMFPGAPLLHWFVSLYGVDRTRGDVIPFTFVGALFLLFLGRIAAMIFPLTFILLKRVAPHPSAVASTYGVAQVCTAGARAIAPWFASALFAWSVEKNVMGGNFIWVAMTVIVLCSVIYTMDLDAHLKKAEKSKRELGAQ